MSRKRKGPEWSFDAPRAPPPSSISLREALVRLNRDAGLDIPYETCIPQKPQTLLRRQVSECYVKLFWRDKVALQQVISRFLGGIQSLTSVESRYRRLLVMLESAQSDLNTETKTRRQTLPEDTDEQFEPMVGPDSKRTDPSITAFFKSSKFAAFSSVKPPSAKDILSQSKSKEKVSYDVESPPGMPRMSASAPVIGSHIRDSYMAGTSQAARAETPVVHPEDEQPLTEAWTSSSPESSRRPVGDDPTFDVDDFAQEYYSSDESSEQDFPSPSASEEDLWIYAEAESSRRSLVSQCAELQNSTVDFADGDLKSPGVDQPTRSILPNSARSPKTKGGQNRNVWSTTARNASILTCIPRSLHDSPFELQSEVQRLLQSNSISSDDLTQRLQDHTLSSFYKVTAQLGLVFRPGYRLRANGDTDFENLTQRAELEWTGADSNPYFKLKALPARVQGTSALQRHLGCGRVLHLDLIFPDGRKGKPDLKRWLSEPQHLLGHTWNLYNVRIAKETKASRGSSDLIFKAILLRGVSVVDVLEWALPFSDNGEQAACKAYSRLDLQVSTTMPLKVLEASDIDYNCPDIHANDDPEDDQFLDPRLAHTYRKPFEQSPMLMNDGCAGISYELLQLYQSRTGLDEPPSVLQGRFAGAKGTWARFLSAPGTRPPGKLIQVNKSQVKVERRTLMDSEPSIRTFNVVKHNTPARPSPLYFHFILILEHRGVPKDVILDMVRAQIQQEGERYLDALKHKGTLFLRDWIASRGGHHEGIQRDFGITTQAGFPKHNEEKTIKMLEAGFDHRANHYLSHLVRGLGKKYFERWSNSPKIGLPQSTSLMGVTDPMGILQPGEIQVMFSRPFKDAAGNTWQILNHMNALVARNPAMAPWDIQKVRVVFRPELKDLTDVIIFPTRGERPLADKLQGGDYDGDTFWICWEPNLVEPFKNAPAPWAKDLPTTKDFEIMTDESKLSEHIPDPTSEKQWRRWLGRMAAARMVPSLLGQVTKLHERLVYERGKIDGFEAIVLVHLHGRIIDADRQGYSFSEQAFEDLKRKLNVSHRLPIPLYQEYIKAKEEEKMGVLTRRKPKTLVDELYVNVIDPEVRKILAAADEVLVRSRMMDEDLTRFYRTAIAGPQKNSVIMHHVRRLKDQLAELRALWAKSFNSPSYPRSDWDNIIADLRSKYEAIQPDLTSIIMRDWARKQGNDMSMWDKLKASAFAEFAWDTKTPGSLVFNVAGSEMCSLKAHELGPSRVMIPEYYCAQRFRLPKSSFTEDDNDETDGEEEDVVL